MLWTRTSSKNKLELIKNLSSIGLRFFCTYKLSLELSGTSSAGLATVRSTDMKYRPRVNYQTVGDGFIISKNIKAKATDINTDYRYADHNPVRLELSFIQHPNI